MLVSIDTTNSASSYACQWTGSNPNPIQKKFRQSTPLSNRIRIYSDIICSEFIIIIIKHISRLYTYRCANSNVCPVSATSVESVELLEHLLFYSSIIIHQLAYILISQWSILHLWGPFIYQHLAMVISGAGPELRRVRPLS